MAATIGAAEDAGNAGNAAAAAGAALAVGLVASWADAAGDTAIGATAAFVAGAMAPAIVADAAIGDGATATVAAAGYAALAVAGAVVKALSVTAARCTLEPTADGVPATAGIPTSITAALPVAELPWRGASDQASTMAATNSNASKADPGNTQRRVSVGDEVTLLAARGWQSSKPASSTAASSLTTFMPGAVLNGGRDMA